MAAGISYWMLGRWEASPLQARVRIQVEADRTNTVYGRWKFHS